MSRNFYTEEEDNNKQESINNYKKLFLEYEKNLPSLSEALNQMFISSGAEEKKSKELIEDILAKCKDTIDKNLDKIIKKYNKINKDDAYIICSYTCELKEKEYSPYRILNINLVSKNRKKGINNISKYLYIFLNSLRKLSRYYPSEENKYLYRCINDKVSLSRDPFNEKLIPYIKGNEKTFWGFTSTSINEKLSYEFLKEEKKIKSGTVFTLGGDIWGYDITLFNYFGEEEILLEPERKFKVDNVLPPLNDIIYITCNILESPLVLDNNNIESNKIYNKIEKENEYEKININDSEIKKSIVRIEMEIKRNDKSKYISGIGFICNIPSKNMKAFITYNNIIDLEFLNNEKQLIFYNENNKKIIINMEIDRYKNTNEKLDFTIIEILEEDNIKNFLEIEEFLNSKDYKDEEIFLSEYYRNKNLEYIKGKIIEKNNNNYFKCSINEFKKGIIFLMDNKKLVGLKSNNNEILPMNIIINKINFIKCIYDIKEEYIGKEVQLLNNEYYDNKKNKIINKEIKEKIKIILKGKIELNILKYKFNKEGKYKIYFISDDLLNNISNLFSGCCLLKEIYLSSFNTNNITNISSMFYFCSSLEKIDLSSFNTIKVTNMSYMFNECLSLKEINLTSFNTENVTNMSYMFYKCSSLKKIDLSSFNTDKVTNMSFMFSECSSLKEIDLSSFNTSNVIKMTHMFANCSLLQELKLPLFNTEKVTNMSFMFDGCYSLEKINLSSFNTNNVTNISYMFCNCTSLKKIDMSLLKSNKVTNMEKMFYGCSSLKEIDLSSFSTNDQTKIEFMFNEVPISCKLKCKDKKILKSFKKEKNICLII